MICAAGRAQKFKRYVYKQRNDFEVKSLIWMNAQWKSAFLREKQFLK
jgi:hypothetical protein